MQVLDLVVAALRFVCRCFDHVLYPPHCLITKQAIAESCPVTSISQQGLDQCIAAPDSVELLLTAQRHIEADDIAFSSITSLWSLEASSPTHAIVHAIKYNGRHSMAAELGTYFGTYLLDQGSDLLCNAEAVTFVAVHATRRRERGYDQAECIAKGIASALNKPLLATVRRTRYTGTQTSLNDVERAANVAGAFCVPLPAQISAKHLLLVDDVFTTGATVNAASAALLHAGARRVDVLTLCATL